MKYIWRKRVGARWWDGRSESLALRFGGMLAIIERPGSERVTLEIVCTTESQGRELVREFGGRTEPLPRNWLHHFTRGAPAKPLRIGSRVVILRRPGRKTSPVEPKQARAIIIPAEAAFGTGEHATTAMCLRLLERITRPLSAGWVMFDAGTGSGILAIAGSCFGARRVVAIDNDPLACRTAKRNARANGVRNIEFSISDLLKHKVTEKFDVITANLFSEILIDALPAWSRYLARGGHLILSGILRNQESAVVRALLRHSFTAPEIRRRGKWIALHSQLSKQKES